MSRRFLLLTALTCAVAMAVLLRTAASDVKPRAAAAETATSGSVVAVLALEDCTIDRESVSGLTTQEAVHHVPTTSADMVEIAVSPHADERGAALTPEVDFRPPELSADLFSDTIRPPPTPHVS